jgi:hypothetical protein
MISQKDAVTQVVMSVVPNYELGGEVVLSDIITSEQKNTMKEKLVAGFRSGQVQMSAEASDKYAFDSELKKYVSGLLDNWIRKNPQFNNGQSYTTKNPGSRSGSGDAQIKALKALLKTVTDAETKTQVQQAIDARLAEIKPEAKVEINVDALPEHLRHLVG